MTQPAPDAPELCGDRTPDPIDDDVELRCTRRPHPGDPWHNAGGHMRWRWMSATEASVHDVDFRIEAAAPCGPEGSRS